MSLFRSKGLLFSFSADVPMMITINIEKRHSYAIVLALALLAGAFLVSGAAPAGVSTHPTLFADMIKGKSGSVVAVMDSLGIGTASPISPLHVLSASGQDFLTIQANGNNHAGIRMMNSLSPNNFIFTNGVTGDISFQTDNSDRVTLKKSGFVGIGTQSPTQRLEVNGAIKESNAGGLFYGNNPGNYGGKELVITVNDGRGGDSDEVWIGPNTGTYKGVIQLAANKVNLVAPGGLCINGDCKTSWSSAGSCRSVSGYATVSCSAGEALSSVSIGQGSSVYNMVGTCCKI